jgi:A/G-specific adenine glycosylase
MLQQTQVDRVIAPFQAFVERFDSIEALAASSAADVLRLWKGLGYNSRAVRLRAVAREVVARFDGRIPDTTEALRSLPGIGAYTASAIRAFAYGLDDVALDTNVRRIVHRLFFGIEFPPKASAGELDERGRAMLPAGDAHDWNSAMMDLGATICTARAPKCLICPLRSGCVSAPVDAALLDAARSSQRDGTKKSVRFEETARFARGRIVDRLRELPPGQRISLLDLHGELAPILPGRDLEQIRALVDALERDGVVAKSGERLALRE